MEQKSKYVAPRTEHKEVELESGFMVTSDQKATIKSDKVTIEVEEYNSIENEVTFD